MIKSTARCLLILGSVILTNIPVATAESPAGAQVVFHSGNWSVLRSKDPMTDAVICTGIYKTQYTIQLNKGNLYVSIRGGIQSYRLRFDDEPAQPLNLASDSEKNINAIDIKDTDFDKLFTSKRLRVEVLTLVAGLVNIDLDLRGLREAYEDIKQDCPEGSAVQPAQQTETAFGLCPAKVVERLKTRGFSDEAIQEVCKE